MCIESDEVFKKQEILDTSGQHVQMLESGALIDIAIERKRQVDIEGYTAEHDDDHPHGELADAAACYALYPFHKSFNIRTLQKLWPWEWSWWKPKNRRYDLVRAAALIIAEIERMDRAKAKLMNYTKVQTSK